MSKELINSQYYLISVVMILSSFAVFFFTFEKRRPQARELVTLAVMSAIAVASRAVFVMIPFFKPMSGIIMITGMAFGPGAGFLTGVVSAFVSNFIFGQGPWTPWQMFAYGVAGALAGFFRKKGIMHENKKIVTAVIGFGIIMIVVGPILDTCAIFTMGNTVSQGYILSIYMSGVIPNLIHGVATVLTLLLLCRPMMEKLNRMKLKYGMMSEE
ncbi:ECF transporter S component [Roseburia sp. 499]|uniref:ECF transporter S component n=1 Tax=Roseburia sp. 499 TaxID=1261634 RepID=UPI00095344A7|nr:ECF transporter S component [Roseburia sp. 499]WVK71026.1 ECF transporter S component [Roseburia sp. 499]